MAGSVRGASGAPFNFSMGTDHNQLMHSLSQASRIPVADIPAFVHTMEFHPDPRIRVSAIRAAERTGLRDKRVAAVLIKSADQGFRTGNKTQLFTSMQAITNLGINDPALVPVLHSTLDTADGFKNILAIRAVISSGLKDEVMVELMNRIKASGDITARKEAQLALEIWAAGSGKTAELEQLLSKRLGLEVSVRVCDAISNELLPEILKLEQEAFPPPLRYNEEERIKTSLEKDFRIVVIREKESGRLIGFVSGYRGTRMFRDSFFIDDIAVRRDFRRGGLGSFLMRKIMGLAKGMGHKKITLISPVENPEKKSRDKFYFMLGFQFDSNKMMFRGL